MKRAILSDYIKNYVAILRLGLPILIGQLGMIVVGFADNAMIGHYSTDALASASFVNNVFNIPILVCMGFSYGLTPLIGALFSLRDNDGIGTTLRRGVVINLFFSLLMTLLMAIIYLNLHRLGQPPHLLPIIGPYFLIYMAGILPISIFQVFAQCAYAVNSSKMPMWVVLGGNVVNVLGNWLLIYGIGPFPELGLIGAGISTLITRWLCMAVIIVVFLQSQRYRGYLSALRGRVVSADAASFRKLFRTSMPIGLQLGFETASFSIAAVMTGWLGHMQLASFQILFTIGTLGFCVYYGMGSAVSALVANATIFGHHAMRRVAFAGYHILLALATLSSLLFLLAGHSLISIFTNDPAVEQMAMTLIPPLILYQLGDATQINFSNALRGTAHVVPMLWIALFSYIIIGVPATYLMGFTWAGGIVGIFTSFSVSLFIAGALFLIFFLRATPIPHSSAHSHSSR